VQRLGLDDHALDRICHHVSRRLDEVIARYAVASQASGIR
jgi:hypothetical protein